MRINLLLVLVCAPDITRVIEVTGMAGEPLLVMRTAFFPILDRSSSFFALILAYISLLNLVVISAKGTGVRPKMCK